MKVAFVCVGNSCRSQMAEGFARRLGGDIFEPYSAGTEPAAQTNPTASLVMGERGIDLGDQYPKLLSELPQSIDLLITMGCNVQCPTLPCKFREDWGIEDPVGKPIEKFREVRDLIEEKVAGLIEKVKANKCLKVIVDA